MRKQPKDLTCWLLLQKSSTTDLVRIPGAYLTSGAANLKDGGAGGGLQLHGIRNSRLVYRKVVEDRSNYISYKKSYFCWFGNPDCGDSTGSNQIEKKDKVMYLFSYTCLREGGAKGRCDLVCGAPVDDWDNTNLCWCLIHVWWVCI